MSVEYTDDEIDRLAEEGRKSMGDGVRSPEEVAEAARELIRRKTAARMSRERRP